MGKRVKKRDLLITASGRGSVSKRLYAARLLQAVLDITGEAGVSIADAKEVLRQMPDMLDSSVCPKDQNVRFTLNGEVKTIKEVWGK